MVIITGVIACIGHRDQAKPFAIDPAEDILEQSVSLRRQGSLPRLRHVAQIHGPQTLPAAISHRDGRRGALLPPPMSQGHNDTVATDRKRGPIPPLGCARLSQPVHDLLDLRAVAVLVHASAQAGKHLAKRGTGPMDIVVLLHHRKHLPLGVIGCPLADALGERGGGSTSVNPDTAYQRMHGTDASCPRFIEASPPVHRAKKCRQSAAILPSSPIEPSLKLQTRRSCCVALGLQAIHDPSHDASANLA